MKGIYFGLLTIAAAEFARVMFSGWDFVGGMKAFSSRLNPETARS